MSWAKQQKNPSYTVYSELDPALDLRRRFIRDPAVRVIGIGLHGSLLDSFLAQIEKDIHKGFGLLELIKKEEEVADGGQELGFGPLGFEATKFHSWLCHGPPEEIIQDARIQLNDRGLIPGLREAKEATEGLVRSGAEPAIWEPWMLFEYN